MLYMSVSSGRKRAAWHERSAGEEIGRGSVDAHKDFWGESRLAKCPNCGNPRINTHVKEDVLPKGIVLMAGVEFGECPKSGCGRVIIYTIAN